MGLQPNESSAEVQQMQQKLAALGFTTPTHGSYDGDTQRAVYAFQEYAQLTPTGTADDYTLYELDRWHDHHAQSQAAEADASHADHGGGGGQDGTLALVDDQGNVLTTGSGTPVSRQGSIEPSTLVKMAVHATCLATPGGANVCAAIDLANHLGWTVAIGVDADLAGVLGISSGFGLYFGSDDSVGIYASVGGDLGAIVGASAAACFTAVKGGPERLAGDAVAFEAGGGEALIAGGAVLFTPNGEFLGVAAEIGIGVGIPVNVFASYSNTRIRPL